MKHNLLRLVALSLAICFGGFFSSLGAATLTATSSDFAAVIKTVKPGDTLVLRGGDYGNAWPANSNYPAGTSNAPIIIKAYSGELPVFKRLHLYNPANAYLTIAGIRFDAQKQAGEAGIISGGAHHITVEDCEFMNSSAAGGLAVYANDNILRRNNIHHNGIRATYDHGIYTYGFRNLFDSNSIHHNAAYGIHNYSGGKPSGQNTIVRNHVWANGQLGGSQNLYAIIVTHSDGTVVENNTIDGGGTGGIAIYYGSKNCRVNNNSVLGNTSPWYDLETGGDCTGTASRNKVNPSKMIFRNTAFTNSDNSMTAPGAGGGGSSVPPATNVTVAQNPVSQQLPASSASGANLGTIAAFVVGGVVLAAMMKD